MNRRFCLGVGLKSGPLSSFVREDHALEMLTRVADMVLYRFKKSPLYRICTANRNFFCSLWL